MAAQYNCNWIKQSSMPRKHQNTMIHTKQHMCLIFLMEMHCITCHFCYSLLWVEECMAKWNQSIMFYLSGVREGYLFKRHLWFFSIRLYMCSLSLVDTFSICCLWVQFSLCASDILFTTFFQIKYKACFLFLFGQLALTSMSPALLLVWGQCRTQAYSPGSC